MPHVRKEILEAIYPPIAYGDTSTAIILKIFDLWVEASSFHG